MLDLGQCHVSAWRRAVVLGALLLSLAGCSDDEPTDHSGHTPGKDASGGTE